MGKHPAPSLSSARSSPSLRPRAVDASIYAAYPLTLRSFLTHGPPPLERALSQQRLPTDDAMAARRMRELFDRPATVAEHASPSPSRPARTAEARVTSPAHSPRMLRGSAERRSASMFTRLGKFTGEVFETKERSRVINALKRRGRGHQSSQSSQSSKFTADDVLRAGTLTKQGSWRRNWKSRFFLLRRDYPSLSYYKSEEKLELLGAITITGDTLVLDKCAAGGHAPYRFQLRTHDASLLLETETRDNQQRWIDACQALVDTLREEKFRQSTLSVDRDPTTAARQSASASGGRHSVATTAASSMTSNRTNGSLLKAARRIGAYEDNQQIDDEDQQQRQSEDLDQLLDGSSDSSSDEEDEDDDEEDDRGNNQKDEEDEEDDDDIWATGRSHHVVLLDEPATTTANTAANKASTGHTGRRGSLPSSSSSRQRASSSTPFYDLVVELVLGRQSKLLSRSESSNDKLSCSVKVLGYSSHTKQSVEIGTTDTVKIAAAVAQHQQNQSQNQSQSPVRITFSVVLRVDLSRFDQLRFTVSRTSSSASKPTTVGLGRLFADDEFKSSPQPRLVQLTEKSSSFPDVLSSSRGEQPSLLTLHGTRGGNAGGSSSSLLTINGNAIQLVVQAFPAKPLGEILPTSGVDMAATKYLLPTTLYGDHASETRDDNAAFIENGSFLTTTSEAPAPPDARLIIVDEILRVPQSTFALPLAFLDFLEETALERTRFLQKQIELSADCKSDSRQLIDEGALAMQAFELEFHRKRMEEYLRQRQFLMKQEKRLLDEAKDHKVFQHTAEQVARAGHKNKKKDTQVGADSDEMMAPFKRSVFKSLDLWQFLPTNMQNQFLCVHQSSPNDKEPNSIPFAWHTMTMGCPAAHTKGFANGGFPLLAPVDPASRPSNPAASGYSDESDYGGPTASDNEFSLERGSALGTQLDALRRRTSFNRTSNTASPGLSVPDAGSDSLGALKARLELKERLDIIASQTLSAAIACLGASMDLAVLGSEYHKLQLANATRFGYLVNFESLLSTQGKEVGMLEDFAAGAKWLRNVYVQFRRHHAIGSSNGQYYSIKSYSPPERRTATGGTGADGTYNPSASLRDQPSPSCLLVTMGVSDAHLAVLPALLAAGKPLRLRCVLFSQGVNEKQSLVHALKSQAVKVQERINRDNLEELKEIYASFRRVHASDSDCVGSSRSPSDRSRENCISRYSLATLDDMLAQIEHHVCSSSNSFKKNVALLMDTSDFCRELGGARVTCCKSGKDRTAMSVTLEQARLCCSQLKVAQGQGRKLSATMRVAGVRRKNVFLNTKSTKFAFNEMQRKLLPDCYKPPAGTYKSGKT